MGGFDLAGCGRSRPRRLWCLPLGHDSLCSAGEWGESDAGEDRTRVLVLLRGCRGAHPGEAPAAGDAGADRCGAGHARSGVCRALRTARASRRRGAMAKSTSARPGGRTKPTPRRPTRMRAFTARAPARRAVWPILATSCLGHVLMENRNRLAAAEATLATGTAEREAAAAFSLHLAKGATLGADKG